MTDGLRAEREQGITIDVAYRFFATTAALVHHRRHPRPRALHAQHGHRAPRPPTSRCPRSTRATASSTQSRRHACLSALLGIQHLVACVNKMDLVDWDEERFREIEGEFRALAERSSSVPDAHGRSRSRRCTATTWSSARDAAPWYDGPPLLEHLETVEVARRPRPATRCASRSSGRSARAAAATTSACYAGQLAGGALRRRRRGASCCRRGARTTVDGGRHATTGRSSRRSRRCRWPCAWPTTSTSGRGDLICAPDDRAGRRARARRDGLLDGRRAAARRARATCSSTRRARVRATRPGRSTARLDIDDAGATKPAPGRARAQRHRARARCAPAPRRAGRPYARQPHHRRVHPHRRAHATTPSAPG